MSKITNVKLVFNFEPDLDGFLEECVDTEGLAKDSAYRELIDMVERGTIDPSDFVFVVEREDE